MKGRLLIAAAKSGSGKTIFTCGLLSYLKKKGVRPIAFKCGPDYIDPMFCERISGSDCENLDPFFEDEQSLRNSLVEKAEHFCVLEGAMGLYDGIAGTGKASCYEVAAKTKTPILLLIDAAGIGRTVLSILKGLLSDDTGRLIAGVVFNRMSGSFLKSIKDEAEAIIAEYTDRGVLLGAIPKAKNINLKSRYLGLLLPDEIKDLKEQAEDFSMLMEENLNMPGLLALADKACPLTIAPEPRKASKTGRAPEALNCPEALRHKEAPHINDRPILAVARDEAFCFYYKKNLRALEAAGADIVYFSPIKDRCLPKGTAGLLLGGGYPELFAEALSQNTAMKESIRKAVKAGMPSLAECGGFLYLHEWLLDSEGRSHKMVGVIEQGSKNSGGLSHFGYVSLSQQNGSGLLKKGEVIKGHEFHYYKSESEGADCIARKPILGTSWECMHMGEEHLWGFVHLFYPSLPGFANRFVNKMIEYKERLQPTPSSRFFENKACEYYPCHEGEEVINCLFCYCPFYWEEDCPGNPVFKEKEDGRKIKSCAGCAYPHKPAHYEEIRHCIADMLRN